MMMPLDGKFEHVSLNSLVGSNAFVTGAARGTGRACAEALVAMGANVVAVDIIEMEAIAGAQILQVNVADEAAVNEVIKRGIDGKPFQIIVNNAAYYRRTIFEKHSTEVWNNTLAVNVNGPFYIMRAAAQALIAAKLPGAFINMSSIAGTHAHKNCAGYCASKAAILGLTRATALDLAPYDITVNAICPGTVDTEMIKQVAEGLTIELDTDIEGAWAYLHNKIPLGRLQTPAEVAASVCFLASNGARSITGTHITIDGGETAG
ncbi:SDR family NAD(P)-dependent oxidoreductase [Paenibacillus eucommiae]|uniref:NAD(P)-dependent dehydrogenase (Short-subunit alcohol dehydrogenase family) n=1 Tax=Paenibacillus eucommiae TaxID=1355755 RepID=A0ABS4IV22_9BACL|nr:SDR family NAD(P)-dependent oxidoreductase [Paenibacillus eucommiae]MBP1990419.1 NAD(P)-dependent dehydrogenase (short-subunit alcohol dehydrogenase family) [Paenibacillus eucommiae]